jgi:hypothetical protein
LYAAVSISYLPASVCFLLVLFLCPADEGDISPRNFELHNPEGRTVHSHRCENLKSKITIYFIDRFSEMSPKDSSSRQQRIGSSSEAYPELLKSTSICASYFLNLF